MMGLGNREPRLGCRWVRDRLPLLVGGELEGSERRKAERHLIGCADCRRERAILSRAVGALHAAAAVSPADSPSLWPALQRQIHEARHEPRQSVVSLSLAPVVDFAAWLESRVRLRPVMAMTVGLAGLIGVGVMSWSRSQTAVANAEALAASRPLEMWSDFGFGPEILFPDLVEPVVGPAPNVAQADPAPSAMVASERPSTAQLDYDLDHGTPMGPDARGFKSSY